MLITWNNRNEELNERMNPKTSINGLHAQFTNFAAFFHCSNVHQGSFWYVVVT